jgi:hypothetical protein
MMGCVALKPKTALRAEIARLIADFLARGGAITRCPGFGEGRIAREDPRGNSFFLRGCRNGGAAAKSARARHLNYEQRSSFGFEARREIRVRFLAGETPSQIAAAFGCDPARVKTVLDEAQLREARP